jgi:hypothetical protein
MTTLPELLAVLHRKGGFEMVNHTVSPARLRLVGRVPKIHMSNWLVLVDRLIAASDGGRPWSVDISKWHFRRSQKVVFAWRLIFQAEEVEKQYADILNVSKTSPGAKMVESDEVHLYGRGDNDTSGGKRGAGPAGSVAVGPYAILKKSMGG